MLSGQLWAENDDDDAEKDVRICNTARVAVSR